VSAVILECALIFEDLSFDEMHKMTDEWTNTSPGKTKHSKNLSPCYIHQY